MVWEVMCDEEQTGHGAGYGESRFRARAVKQRGERDAYWPLAASAMFFAPLLPTDATAEVACCSMLICIDAIVIALFWSAICCIWPIIEAFRLPASETPEAVIEDMFLSREEVEVESTGTASVESTAGQTRLKLNRGTAPA
jgi:hypothetical protein